MKKCLKKQKGNVSNIIVAGFCILAMTVVMFSYMESVSLIQQKTEISQLARKYILRMETVGYLTAVDRTSLFQELDSAGVTEINLGGTTLSEASYGSPIALCISGKLKGEYAFEEKRVSTAKN